MKEIFGCIVLIAVSILPSVAQMPMTVSEQRAEILIKNIKRVFYDSASHLFRETNEMGKDERKHSYLWPLCGLIQAANEMEAARSSGDVMAPVMQSVSLYYSKKPPCAGYDSYVVQEGGGDRFYDDNQWIGLATIDAYNRTGVISYLQVAREMYRFMMSGYDTASGGGLYWKEGDITTKNTCSNGPGIILALQLYLVEKEKKYLDTAIVLYEWTRKHLQAPSGIYYDAIKIPSGRIDKATYSYNTGTMLQSAVLLYDITGKTGYLEEAQKMAAASLDAFYKTKFPGNYWFNAVLMRGFIELYKVDKNKKYLQTFIHDADRIWNEEKDTNDLIGTKQNKKLLDQAAMLEMYARIAKLEKEGF